MTSAYDIAIAGGGPVGAALALALQKSSHRIALLEARPLDEMRDDARTIALSHGSRLILERLGVWSLLNVTEIRTIVVSQQRQFGRVELTAREADVPALGYVTAYAGLQRILGNALRETTVDVLDRCSARAIDATEDGATVMAESGNVVSEINTRLVVLADGADGLKLAEVDERDYGQSALVCDIESDAPHDNRAFERFTLHGPLALLPTQRGWSIVWTAQPSRALELAALDDKQFCEQLHKEFGGALGEFRLIGHRQVFPLKLKRAQRPRSARTVLVGNAAQSLHPVAGQGFNLGLRDAWELARVVRDAHDPGAAPTLNRYFGERRFDRTATILFTDTLIRLFSNDIPVLARLAGAGIAALGVFAPAKNFLVRRMMFGARG